MTPKELRYTLADDIRNAAGTNGWAVYSAPPLTVTAPAAVIAPRSPYRVSSTFCDEEVRLSCTLVLPFGAGADGLDTLDDAATIVRDAINKGTTGARVSEVTDVGPTLEVAGVEYLTATLNIDAQT